MKNNKQSNLLLQISLIKDIGSNTIHNLLTKIGADDFLNLHQFKVLDFLSIGLSQARANQLVAGLQDFKALSHELDLIAKYGANWTTILDESYPELLKHIPGAPPVLY